MNPVIQKFQTVNQSTRFAMRAVKSSPLLLGLTTLHLSKESFNEDYLSAYEISEALGELGYDVKRDQIAKAFKRTKGTVRTKQEEEVVKYKIMQPGEEMVEKKLLLDHSDIIYIDSGKPFTGKRKLESILSNLSGDVRICDPYYGKKSLNALSVIPKLCRVKFLTSKTTENKSLLSADISTFKRQYSYVELREIAPPNDIHDRYILDDSGISIIGHGIKDIGSKESFIIQLDKSVASDIIQSLKIEFDNRWSKALSL